MNQIQHLQSTLSLLMVSLFPRTSLKVVGRYFSILQRSVLPFTITWNWSHQGNSWVFFLLVGAFVFIGGGMASSSICTAILEHARAVPRWSTWGLIVVKNKPCYGYNHTQWHQPSNQRNKQEQVPLETWSCIAGFWWWCVSVVLFPQLKHKLVSASW